MSEPWLTIRVLALRAEIRCPTCGRTGALTLNPDETLQTPFVECISCRTESMMDLRPMLESLRNWEHGPYG
jgi:hypothetical protein